MLGRRSTPAGQHRPVLLEAVLNACALRPGAIVVDATVGWAGHALELLKQAGASGLLIGLDLDADNLPEARKQLESLELPFELHHGNFAGLARILGEKGIDGVDAIVADLGMSSMQVDDPNRGFSYRRGGPLDMRMDRSRGKTLAEILGSISKEDLATALEELGDEPQAAAIASAMVDRRTKAPLMTTSELVEVIEAATKQQNRGPWQLHPGRNKWNMHPAARTFQALRILVNRELNNLKELLRQAPGLLKPGGVLAIISFHSGEDRLVKAAFREGRNSEVYEAISPEAVRASFSEKQANPRSRSAKLRWARKK